jgi:hypothetical protein
MASYRSAVPAPSSKKGIRRHTDQELPAPC